MTRMLVPASALAALAMAGCAPVGAPAEARTDGEDPCGAQRVQDYRGAQADAAVRASVARKSGARAIRWIGPDDAVTMDYSPDRLNAELGRDGRIVSLRCG